MNESGFCIFCHPAVGLCRHQPVHVFLHGPRHLRHLIWGAEYFFTQVMIADTE
jgi:hypothetical protein